MVVAARIGRVWSIYAPGQMASYNQNEGRPVWASWLAFASFWVLVPFAAWGGVLLRRRKVPITPLVAQFVIVTITAAAIYGLVRFRVPAEVSLVVLAAVAFDHLWSRRGAARDRAGMTMQAPRGMRRAGYVLLALLAYVPLLLTHPGRVVADTKTYLYLDPGRLLVRAVSMWDPHIGLGTVTHQNIGYLFPMGPLYWLTHLLGVPAWVAQRLWLGTILLFAGLGMLYLMRTLKVRGPGVAVAAVVFLLSPYALDFSARLSVILLPWAGLPWMLALVIPLLREDRGWMYPAWFAITVQLIGGVNATALVFAGIAPVAWIIYAALVRDVARKRAPWSPRRSARSRCSRRCGGSQASRCRAPTASTS